MWQQMKRHEDRAASSPLTEFALVSLFFILKIWSISVLFSYGIPSEHLLRIIHTEVAEKFTKLTKS